MPFSRFPLRPELLKAVKELGFTRPTPIQEKAIPPVAEGRDLLACAMTGSGKTAAFLLPILHRLMDRPRGATRALVLTPTRELAAQIHEHFEQLSVHTSISAAPVFGGVSLGPQEHAFRRRVDLVVATPGRLLDHMRHPYAKLSDVEIVVLDEADRMLDMGFLPDVRRILRGLPGVRQTLMFSATVPREIHKLATEMLRDPITIDIGRKSAPATGITQAVYPVPQALKTALLLELLAKGIVKDAIVFTRTKHRADRVANYLERYAVPVARIHGNRSQSQRTAALDGFKAGTYRVLVATDIVSRGIDAEALGHVINFDVPDDPDSYIHRVGRTGRAEMTGSAFTFVSPEEADELRAIEQAVGGQLPRVMLPDFDYMKRPAERLELTSQERRAAARTARGTSSRGAQARGGPARAGQRRPGDGAGAGGGAGAGRPAGGAGRPGGARPGGGRPGGPKRRPGQASADERLAAILERHGGGASAGKPAGRPAAAPPDLKPAPRRPRGKPRRPR